MCPPAERSNKAWRPSGLQRLSSGLRIYSDTTSDRDYQKLAGLTTDLDNIRSFLTELEIIVANIDKTTTELQDKLTASTDNIDRLTKKMDKIYPLVLAWESDTSDH